MGETFVLPWQPVKWKPVYDMMIALHISGVSNVEIGKQLDYTPVQVGNILRSDEGKNYINQIQRSIRSQMSDDIPTRLEQLKQLSYNRISEALSNEELAQRSPLAVASTAMSFLKGIGSLNDGGTKIQNNNFTAGIPVQHVTDLIAVMKESNSLQKDYDAEVRSVDRRGAGEASSEIDGREEHKQITEGRRL